VLCTALLELQFGFVSFWQKDIDAKAGHTMLMELTPEISNTQLGLISSMFFPQLLHTQTLKA